MKKSLFLLSLLAIVAGGCNLLKTNESQTDMDSVKTKSLCVLEETDVSTTYLIALTRLVRKAGDELIVYAGGNELFLRYGTVTISKSDEKSRTAQSAILHSMPERIAMPEGGSYDAAAYEIWVEADVFYENGKETGHPEPPRKWRDVGLSSDNGIPSRIEQYFYNHREEISVAIEDLESYNN